MSLNDPASLLLFLYWQINLDRTHIYLYDAPADPCLNCSVLTFGSIFMARQALLIIIITYWLYWSIRELSCTSHSGFLSIPTKCIITVAVVSASVCGGDNANWCFVPLRSYSDFNRITAIVKSLHPRNWQQTVNSNWTQRTNALWKSWLIIKNSLGMVSPL